MTTQLTFLNTLKAGAIAGFVGAGLNHVWSFIAQALGSVPPPGFALAVTISSVLLVVVGAVFYFLLARFVPKGALIWTVVGVIFMLASCYSPTLPTLPDGTAAPEGFALLTIPMHLISGLIALWGIPRWSN